MVLCAVFVLAILCSVVTTADDGKQEMMDEFAMDADYKILIQPRSAECFYGVFVKTTTVMIHYEVIDGGDRKIDVSIKELLTQKVLGEFEDTITEYRQYVMDTDGHVEFCFKNLKSSFQKKLMNLGIYHLFKRPMSAKDKTLLSSYEVASNFSDRFNRIYDEIFNISMSSKGSQLTFMRDFLRMKRNRDYVQYWAVLNVLVIVVTSFTQVYFVRQFFRSPDDGKRARV